MSKNIVPEEKKRALYWKRQDKNRSLIVCEDLSAISNRAAERFLELANDSLDRKGVFSVALSGGSTPEYLYRLLAGDQFRRKLSWDKVHFFWGDERCVSPDQRESNYRMAFNAWLEKLNLSKKNIHRIKAEEGEKAALLYEQELKRFFKLKSGEIPEFDLILLGLGDDGHTASLFPGSLSALKEEKKLAAFFPGEKLKTMRITLTPRLIRNALNIIFLISGKKKAFVLQQVLEGEYRPDKFPAQLLRRAKGRITWFVDRKAASKLKGVQSLG